MSDERTVLRISMVVTVTLTAAGVAVDLGMAVFATRTDQEIGSSRSTRRPGS